MRAFTAMYMTLSNMLAKQLNLPAFNEAELEAEIERITYVLRLVADTRGIKDGKVLATTFLDMAYRGEFEGLNPQVPREAVDQVLAKFQLEWPNIWGVVCSELGLETA